MRKVIFILLALLGVMFLTGGASGQVPQVMNYQGYLTDATGAPVPDGNYTLTFAIYDAESDGTALWTETQRVVPVSKGLFNIILGSVVPINLPFDKPYWLGVMVGTEPELVPRMRLTSAGYSFRAGDANSVKGIPASTIPTANSLFPLGPDAKFPAAVLPAGLPPGQHAATHNEGGSDAITITSALIQDGAIATADLADNAVTSAKIQNGQVANADIADNAVTTSKIANGAVTQTKLAAGVTLPPGGAAGGDLSGTYPNPTIAAGAVSTAKLANNAVTTDKIANGTITGNDINSSTTITAQIIQGGGMSGSTLNSVYGECPSGGGTGV